MAQDDIWPDLPLSAWRDTCATLHLWTQVVGKIRLALAPPINHWWHVPLYVSCRGLTTSPLPYGSRSFAIDFDFVAHRLRIEASDGAADGFALRPMTVADFHAETMQRLGRLGLDVHIWPMPVEIAGPVRFDLDRQHAAYDLEYANRFWRVLLQASRVLTEFRGRFLGKASPVHFFWGSFDLAVTRFSGRAAPPHPGAPNIADRITREAYSHEVSSCGFWPGGPGMEEPVFYSYAYPSPAGFAEAPVRPAAAFYSREFGEFILPYRALRQEAAPDEALVVFLQSTYEAAADCAHWDRAALKRAPAAAA
jgi:Family of unknown function (DUF5996)